MSLRPTKLQKWDLTFVCTIKECLYSYHWIIIIFKCSDTRWQPLDENVMFEEYTNLCFFFMDPRYNIFSLLQLQGGMSNELYNTIARVTDGIYEGMYICWPFL